MPQATSARATRRSGGRRSVATTIGQWVHLPASGGASDRVRADQPGGAGWLQLAASNGTHAARELGLRTLWEDPGSALVYADLAATGAPSTLRWHDEETSGVYVRLCGTYRVRLYGETVTVPRVHLACRALAPAGYETGVALLVQQVPGAPECLGAALGTTSTTSTSATALSVTLSLTPLSLGRAEVETDDEHGDLPTVTIYVGAWCTSGSSLSKGAVYGLTVSLLDP
jgi:hypothetical protein